MKKTFNKCIALAIMWAMLAPSAVWARSHSDDINLHDESELYDDPEANKYLDDDTPIEITYDLDPNNPAPSKRSIFGSGNDDDDDDDDDKVHGKKCPKHHSRCCYVPKDSPLNLKSKCLHKKKQHDAFKHNYYPGKCGNDKSRVYVCYFGWSKARKTLKVDGATAKIMVKKGWATLGKCHKKIPVCIVPDGNTGKQYTKWVYSKSAADDLLKGNHNYRGICKTPKGPKIYVCQMNSENPAEQKQLKVSETEAKKLLSDPYVYLGKCGGCSKKIYICHKGKKLKIGENELEGYLEFGSTKGKCPNKEPVCGNGKKEAGEECDDRFETDKCNADCTTASCGDNKVNSAAGEECDGTYGCNPTCQWQKCGDSQMPGLMKATNGTWVSKQCDLGAGNSWTGACLPNCKNNVCGDGHKGPGEECDGGPGCNVNCTIKPTCGNGTPDAGEECDDGTAGNGWDKRCLPCCALNKCGDGHKGPGEECDHGALNGPNAACLPNCKLNVCGNGVYPAPGKECDDGAGNGDDKSCTLNCKRAGCGDGLVWEGKEGCDLGYLNNTNSGACLTNCENATCGDGFLYIGEEFCDDGAKNGKGDGWCLDDCSGRQQCGDGAITGTETCDDGAKNGKGEGFCTNDCKAVQTCGNGVREGTEQCDGEPTCNDDCTLKGTTTIIEKETNNFMGTYGYAVAGGAYAFGVASVAYCMIYVFGCGSLCMFKKWKKHHRSSSSSSDSLLNGDSQPNLDAPMTELQDMAQNDAPQQVLEGADV